MALTSWSWTLSPGTGGSDGLGHLLKVTQEAAELESRPSLCPVCSPWGLRGERRGWALGSGLWTGPCHPALPTPWLLKELSPSRGLGASPGLHPTVTTAKQKTGAEASPFTGTSASRHTQASPYAGTAPYAGTSPHAVTSPFTGTPPHEATSPHAGTSRPATQLDSTSAETSLVPSSRSSKSRVSIPMVRILAPVLVLLSLLLTAGLAALSRYLLRRRKEAQLAAETQRMEKVHLPHSPLENCWVQECAKINTAGPAGPRASPQPSSSPCRDIGCLSQTSEEAEASSRDPEGATIPGPPLHLSEEELDFSKFISV
ncbi:CMRF35-like molecule 9 isoform X10 [Equus przewalskii]|uniref:CMRF35-like molecule 9 isoform X10 n=1 Tax=Equus przewalskii TaxID=9798 RepID=A0ABM4JKJ9_EQUPR